MTREQIIYILDKHIPEFSGEVRRYCKSRLTKMAIVDELLSLAKAEQPTDEDIEKWAGEVQPIRGGYLTDYIYSAKAMRDGLITKTK